MEGTTSPASIAIGDDNDQFQNNPNGGHDVFLAGPGDADFDMEGGDDIMVGNVLPTHRFEGMLGFDWVTYRGEVLLVDADMLITGAIAVNAPLNELRDRFDNVEGLSGTPLNDLLRGDDRAEADLRVDPLISDVANAHVLSTAGIARIAGLQAVLGTGVTEFAGGNIILGGAGSDLLEGRGGNDVIDGDAWLQVQLQAGAQLATSLHQLRAAVLAGSINPGSIQIVRSITTAGALATDIDVAVFSGPSAEYSINPAGPNTFIVSHLAGAGADGTDRVRNVETLRFADGDIATTGVGAVSVPNLTGLTQAQAVAALAARNLTLGAITEGNHPTVAVGLVAGQSPLPGVGVAANSAVSIMITLGTLVPDIHESSVADGSTVLVGAGLVPGTVVDVNSDDIPVGFVASTNPAAGATVPPGTVVTILRSAGPATANRVPAVSGLPQGDAEEAILGVGLTVGAITFANSATIPSGGVISTTPAAGTLLAPGSAVAIRVSLGADGLVLALGFNETTGQTTLDSSAVLREATLRQATMQFVPGRFGNAVRFDGVNDWVTVTDGAANSPLDLTNGMTLEAWVRPESVSGWNTILLKERGAAGTAVLSYGMYAQSGGAADPNGADGPSGFLRPAPAASTSDVGVFMTNPAQLPLNTWTHVAMTYDATAQRMRLYINGVLAGERVQTGNIAQGNQPVRIGGNNVFGGEWFTGLIDEVRIYNRARTAAQIQADMNTPIQTPQ
jgi:beta-lactam-binding protein with PASTA domain